MNNNERIARWRGVVEPDDYNANPRDCLMIHGTEVVRFYVGLNPGTERWSPDTDITLWHGEDGLLDEIEKSELRNDFMSALIVKLNVYGCPKDITVWRVRQAEPSQLAAVLCKVIEENSA